jgi:hypothetical protein
MKLMSSFRLCACAAIVTVWAGFGCQNQSDQPKAHILKGRVTKIDVSSGIVTGKFWIEKQNDEIELSGKLAPDAEIIVNGRTASLEDVRIDDPVEVVGWEEKSNNERRLIAKKVEIERPAADTRPAGASRPAEASTSR